MSNVDVPHDKDAGADDPFAGMSDIERLLAEEGVDLGSVEEYRPAGAEGMSARDWMIATSDDEMIRKRIGEEPILDAPAWLTAQSDEPEDDPFAGMSDIERLLAEEGIDLSSVDEERPAGAEGMSARDWMITTSDDEVIRKRIGGNELILDENPPTSADDDNLPDWLRDVEDEPALAPVAAGDDDLPDWLQEIDEPEEATSTKAAGEMVIDDDLPDWLLAEEEEPETPEPAPVVDDQMVIGDDLPDWLRDDEEAAEEVESVVEAEEADWLPQETALPAALTAENEGDIEVEEDGLPDWLREAQAEELELAQPVVIAFAEEDNLVVKNDLPEWLREVEEESHEPVMDTPIIETLPDWLKDELEEAGDAEEAPLFDDAYSSADIDEENLPDWLADVAVDDEPFEPSEPSPLDIDETDEENLPDWLLDVQQQAVTAELTVAGVAASQTDLPDVIEEDELPAWLQEEAAEAPLEFTQEPVPVAEMVEPGLAEAIEAEPEPEIPPAPVVAAVAPVVAPPEPKPETPAPAVPAPSPTGMPDWLKKLREGDTEFAETTAVAAPLPGPLAPPKRAARVQMFAPEPDSLAEPSFEDLPEDPAERLKLAQSCREQGDVDLAVRAYESLVSGGHHLDKVIDDLQQLIKTRPADFRLYQVLGDGLMKDGRLQNALEAYRAALGKLAAG